eukprot:2366182-Lingulodinium_polyedra.AAC.1
MRCRTCRRTPFLASIMFARCPGARTLSSVPSRFNSSLAASLFMPDSPSMYNTLNGPFRCTHEAA